MSNKLEYLIERLKRCKPGEDYPLTAIERQIILEALDSKTKSPPYGATS